MASGTLQRAAGEARLAAVAGVAESIPCPLDSGFPKESPLNWGSPLSTCVRTPRPYGSQDHHGPAMVRPGPGHPPLPFSSGHGRPASTRAGLPGEPVSKANKQVSADNRVCCPLGCGDCPPPPAPCHPTLPSWPGGCPVQLTWGEGCVGAPHFLQSVLHGTPGILGAGGAQTRRPARVLTLSR